MNFKRKKEKEKRKPVSEKWYNNLDGWILVEKKNELRLIRKRICTQDSMWIILHLLLLIQSLQSQKEVIIPILQIKTEAQGFRLPG